MFDPVTATTQEHQLRQRKFDSDLGAQLRHQAKQLRGRDADPTLSVDQQDELVSLIVSTAGDRAISDLKEALDEATARAVQRAAQYANPKSGYRLHDTLPEVQNQIRLARQYRERLAALTAKATGAIEAAPGEPAVAPPPTEMEEVHALFLKAAGQFYIDDLTRQLSSMSQELPHRLAVVLADIENATASHAAGPITPAHYTTTKHQAIWDRLSWLIARREDLKAKIARVEGDQTKAVAVQAQAVSAVITAAGGKDAVVKAMTDSRKLRDRYWGSHPEWSATAANAATLNQLRAQLAKLGDNPTGPTADQLRADLATAEASCTSNASTVDADLQSRIVATIDAAMAGDEPARLEILGDALGEPRAFPAGFVDQLDAAMFPKSRDGSALLALVLSTGLPLS